MTSIQALNVQLRNKSEYWLRVVLSLLSEVVFLFWINNFFMAMLKANVEVYILDCTWKTIRHSMPLAILNEVTGLDISFYSGMCSMKRETAEDYERLFGYVSELYQHVDIPLLVVWLTDDDVQIAIGLKAAIPDASHALCIWHVEQKVGINCKKQF